MPLEEAMATQDRANGKIMKIQEIMHTLLLCGAEVPLGRAPRGNMARQLTEAIPEAERGKGKGVMGAALKELANQARFRKDC